MLDVWNATVTTCELAFDSVTVNVITVVAPFAGAFTVGLSIEIVGCGFTVTVIELVEEHPAGVVTVSVSVSEPVAPAVYVTVCAVAPLVIVPFPEIDHAYPYPAPPTGVVAVLPVVPVVTADRPLIAGGAVVAAVSENGADVALAHPFVATTV